MQETFGGTDRYRKPLSFTTVIFVDVALTMTTIMKLLVNAQDFNEATLSHEL